MSTRAIHFIWTTYGTWLPGDDRGHWSPLYDLYGRLKARGHQLNVPDLPTRTVARDRMPESPKVFSPDEIQCLAEVLGRLCTTYSPAFTPVKHSPTLSAAMQDEVTTGVNAGLYEAPQIVAAAIEPTHVHLLTGPLKQDVAQFAGRMKGASSSVLLKRPENADRKRIWTTGYWRVFLFDDPAVTCVKDYIEQHNERRGLRSEPFEWITPSA